MTDDSMDKIAEYIGTVTEERDEEKDNKEQESEEADTFDIEEYRRNLDEYEGGW